MLMVLSSCASRSYTNDHNFINPFFNLYNRNYIVAAPTLIGNVICGAPFFFLAGGLDSLSPHNAPSEFYYGVINGIFILPASICGAMTGTLFVPISYLCPENPWYIGKEAYIEKSCSPAKSDSPLYTTKKSNVPLKSNLPNESKIK